MEIVELTGTTDGAGALTLTGASRISGKFMETIVYDWSDGDTGADIVVTMQNGAATQAIMTKANLGVADATFYPRTLGNKVADGSAFTDPATKMFCVGTPKIVVAAGGATKTLRFLMFFSDE
jgi:hypothetical protein